MTKSNQPKKASELIQKSKILNTTRSYIKKSGGDFRVTKDAYELLRALSTMELVRIVRNSSKVKGDGIKTLKGRHYRNYRSIIDDSQFNFGLDDIIKKRPVKKPTKKLTPTKKKTPSPPSQSKNKK